MKTRSFRYEDYNNRRVFLRSYPLQWEEDDRANESTRRVAKEKSKEKPIKKMILSVVQWGEGRVVIIRKLKDKLIVYIIACVPTAFKPQKALISAWALAFFSYSSGSN